MFAKFTFASLSLACLASLAIASPVNTNLLVNPSAVDGFNGWTFSQYFNSDPGNNWAIGGESQDADNASFVSSWPSNGYFTQTIDLQSLGFSASELDAGPAVSFMGWTKSTQWAADHARALYQLKNGLGQVLAQSDTGYINNLPFEWTPLAWQSTLPAGTRQISVTYYGYDGEGWYGWYGTAFDAASVTVAPEPTSLSLLALAGTVLVRRRR